MVGSGAAAEMDVGLLVPGALGLGSALGSAAGRGRSCMSAMPAETMWAMNSSGSMLSEFVLMVSMKDAAEYCVQGFKIYSLLGHIVIIHLDQVS